MKRKSLFVRMLFVTVVVFVLGICNVFGVSTVEAQTILKFSHTDQQQGARQGAAEVFAKKVEQYTNGRYKVQVYCCSQLGNDPKNIEQLVLGGIDFTVSSTGSYAPHLAGLNLTMLPFIVDSYEQGWKLYDESKWMKAEFDKAPQKGFRFLSTFEAGFRCMTTKEPLRTPDDAKGKKLRTFPNEMMRWTLDAIGFSVQIMPLPEVYMAPYETLTNHVYSPIPLAISEKTWQKLSAADREAVTKAAKEAADWSRKTIQANDDNQLKEMASKGAKVTNPSADPFRKAVQPVYGQARDKYGAADVDAFLADAAAVRKALPVK